MRYLGRVGQALEAPGGHRRRTSPRTRSQNYLPAGPRACRRGDPRDGDLRGAGLLHPGLLQVAVEPFTAVLKANHLSGSMGRVSSAGDNAAMESFYSLLQKNVLNRRRWRTRDELAYEITYWFEHTYNRRRQQRGLGRLTLSSMNLPLVTPPLMWPDATVNQTQSRPGRYFRLVLPCSWRWCERPFRSVVPAPRAMTPWMRSDFGSRPWLSDLDRAVTRAGQQNSACCCTSLWSAVRPCLNASRRSPGRCTQAPSARSPTL